MIALPQNSSLKFASLAHFLGADALIQSFYVFLVANFP